MSGINGYPTSVRLDNYVQDEVKKEFVTIQPLGSNQQGLDVVQTGYYQVATGLTAEAGSSDKLLVITGHSFKNGDLIKFQSTSNSIDESEVRVFKIVDANTVELTGILSDSLTAGDTLDHYRPTNVQLTSSGAAVSGPVRFNLDGSEVEVTEDTVTPANNIPLPVKLMGVTGTINVTSDDLNVQLSHTGASPDSIQLGDGTNLLGITASNEAQVFDATTHTKLDTIAALDFATETTLGTRASETTAAAILAKIIAAPATEAKQDTIITNLGSLLTELQAKADLSETQPVSAASLPLPTGAATAANQSTANASLSTIEGDTTSIDGKLPATLGQKASTASLAVVLSTEQEALIDGLEASLSSIDGKLPTALGQQNSAGSTSVVLASDYELPLEAMDVVDTTSFIDVSSSNIPASAGSPLEIIASTAAAVKKVQTIEDVGEFIGLYTGAAASEVFYCYLPIAGGEVDVDIPAGTRLSIRNMKAATISTSTFFAMNLIG